VMPWINWKMRRIYGNHDTSAIEFELKIPSGIDLAD
jgi:hypothetical protein